MAQAQEIFTNYVQGQAQCAVPQHNAVAHDDMYCLVAFPKSGSSWNSYNLFQLKTRGKEALTDNIKRHVVDITPGHLPPHMDPMTLPVTHGRRTCKSHARPAWRDPRCHRFLYLLRNPRDTFLSLYYFFHSMFELDAEDPAQACDLHWFYYHVFRDRCGSVTDNPIGNPWIHIAEWWQRRNPTGEGDEGEHKGDEGDKVDEHHLWLCYEDLAHDPTLGLMQANDFLQLPELTAEELCHIVSQSRMESVQQLPHEHFSLDPPEYIELVRGMASNLGQYMQTLPIGKVRRRVRRITSVPDDILADMEDQWQRWVKPVTGCDNYPQLRELIQQSPATTVRHPRT